jgi:hypothetical protein
MEYNSGLYTVGTTTGAAALVGTNTQSYAVYALLFESGTLYGGVDSDSSCSGCIVTFDTGAGTLTQGSNTDQTFGGLAPDPLTTTPEPATWSLFALALAAFAVGRRRRLARASSR